MNKEKSEGWGFLMMGAIFCVLGIIFDEIGKARKSSEWRLASHDRSVADLFAVTRAIWMDAHPEDEDGSLLRERMAELRDPRVSA